MYSRSYCKRLLVFRCKCVLALVCSGFFFAACCIPSGVDDETLLQRDPEALTDTKLIDVKFDANHPEKHKPFLEVRYQ